MSESPSPSCRNSPVPARHSEREHDPGRPLGEEVRYEYRQPRWATPPQASQNAHYRWQSGRSPMGASPTSQSCGHSRWPSESTSWCDRMPHAPIPPKWEEAFYSGTSRREFEQTLKEATGRATNHQQHPNPREPPSPTKKTRRSGYQKTKGDHTDQANSNWRGNWSNSCGPSYWVPSRGTNQRGEWSYTTRQVFVIDPVTGQRIGEVR